MFRLTQQILDLLLLGALGALPRSLGWSRRSSRTVLVAGAVAAAAGSLPCISSRPVARITARRREIVGLFLLAVQFQLTEEESPVRSAVAAIGLLLILLGLVSRLLVCRNLEAERGT
ncbi:MAG: hypothetical protein WBW04_17305 [Nitrolancea sp.]